MEPTKFLQGSFVYDIRASYDQTKRASKVKNRFQLIPGNNRFNVAAKEMRSNKAKINCNKACRSFKWIPLRVKANLDSEEKSEKEILVNVHSLSKAIHMSVKEIKQLAGEGRLEQAVNTKLSMTQAALKRTDAFQEAKASKKTGLNVKDLLKISLYIEENRELLLEALGQTEGKTLYKKKEETALPRTFQIIEIPGDKKESPMIVIHCKRHHTPLLGIGGFKTVSKSLNYETSEIFANAVTTFKSNKARNFERIHSNQEKACLEDLKGMEGVVQYYAITDYSLIKRGEIVNKSSILMKFYNQGSLTHLMRKKQLTFENKEQITTGILKGLASMHDKGIFHLDIKTDNIFVEKSDTGIFHAVLGDLGLATRTERIFSIKGTPNYMPPEVNEGKEREARKQDIWGMGCVLYHLFYEELPPWIGDYIPEMDYILPKYQNQFCPNPTQKDMEDIFVNKGDDFRKELLKKLLAVDPDQRPTAQEVLKMWEDYLNTKESSLGSSISF